MESIMAGKTKQKHEFEDSGQWQGNNTYMSVYLYVCMCVYIKRDMYMYIYI